MTRGTMVRARPQLAMRAFNHRQLSFMHRDLNTDMDFTQEYDTGQMHYRGTNEQEVTCHSTKSHRYWTPTKCLAAFKCSKDLAKIVLPWRRSITSKSLEYMT